jgi:hypothetical protein
LEREGYIYIEREREEIGRLEGAEEGEGEEKERGGERRRRKE